MLEDKPQNSDDEDEDIDLYDGNNISLMTPEELRREIYENILKRRIFHADRLEKVEKVLL